jgi:Zn-dependent protease
VLWALTQPAAVGGLVAAFLIGLGVRGLAQRGCGRLVGRSDLPVRADPRRDLDALGALAAVLSGTGWGRTAAPPADRRCALAVLAGPLAVIAASQVALAGYHAAYPGDGLTLRINRTSDVLHGAVAPTPAAQLLLSAAVGLLCFGLLALVPLPPLDGYRLLRLFLDGAPGAPAVLAERLSMLGLLLLLVVPIGAQPPLLAALDLVGDPLVRAWA